ncbi:hypothetical protein F2P56_019766 [Juglans regia]|uniref:TIR domain-containing protein n=2 Tax=Juglans regia TaxID=51240 RepID=A0A833USN6_JUGRE|nr:E3 ubiquitin-protein ligase COP1-like [Juglans regia]KAF5459853.1 hypothetical protein F2P56_019766 [Juglans regia]
MATRNLQNKKADGKSQVTSHGLQRKDALSASESQHINQSGLSVARKKQVLAQDEDELPKGENISEKLINAIHGSRISIVDFHSKGYASSRWCLDELVEIMDGTKTRGHNLIPTIYHVEPRMSENRKGLLPVHSLGVKNTKDMRLSFKQMDRVKRWKIALCYSENCTS